MGGWEMKPQEYKARHTGPAVQNGLAARFPRAPAIPPDAPRERAVAPEREVGGEAREPQPRAEPARWAVAEAELPAIGVRVPAGAEGGPVVEGRVDVAHHGIDRRLRRDSFSPREDLLGTSHEGEPR